MSKRRENAKKQISKQIAGTQNDLPARGVDESVDTVALEGGKFCLDVAKLVFAGVILAGIMKEDANTTLLYVVGVAVVLFFICFGFYLIKQSKRNRR